jgi:anti-sigma-K factor RskA/putative zinc finger protein
MPEHEHFRELSSLALVGELSPAELAELTLHLRECPSCQATYSEFTQLAEDHLALGDRRPGRSRPPASNRLRESVLQRVEEQGLRISPEALRGPTGFAKHVTDWLSEMRWAVLPRAAHMGISAALLALVAVTGFAFRYNTAQKHEIERLRADLSRTRDGAGQLEHKLSAVSDTESRVETNTERLEQQLADAAARTTKLDSQHEQDLAAIHGLQTRIDQLSTEDSSVAQRASSDDAELVSLRAQLQNVRANAGDKEAQLVASEYQVTALSNQLKGQQSALEREQQLLAAGRDIRDLMGARNLHIIDVHDMDARGESRPFGRIFLTEGKRLIFYAYDLDAIKSKNASFQAWGQGEGGSPTPVSLGILYMDDQAQSRWALKVEDPNLLTAINSVFVTVEPHGGTEKPTGKKLMYAYLRNPINHP